MVRFIEGEEFDVLGTHTRSTRTLHAVLVLREGQLRENKTVSVPPLPRMLRKEPVQDPTIRKRVPRQ